MVNFYQAVKEFKRVAENCRMEVTLRSEEPDANFCETIVNFVFREAKINLIKKALKNVLLPLQSSNSADLESCIMKNLDKLIDEPVPDVAVQFLLENFPNLRGCFSPYVAKLVHLCIFDGGILSDIKDDSKSHSHDALCGRLKTVLEIIQFLQNDIERCFKYHDKTSYQLIEISRTCLKILRCTKEYTDATRAMAGIYLGNLLNYCTDDSNLASIILNICKHITPLPTTSSCVPVPGLFATLCPDPKESTQKGNYVGLVFLLKGLFSCTRSSVFYVCLSDIGTLLHVVFDVICEVSELQGELQYHGLQVLKLWWAKVQVALKLTDYVSNIQDIVSKESKFAKMTLQLIFRQWDSPISGAPAIVLDVLSLLIAIQQIIGNEEIYLNCLLEKLMMMPASIKRKYNCVTLLITKIGAKKILQKYPHFIYDMKPLLAVNHLFPVISKTYRAIVADVAKQKDDELWRNALLPGLVTALVDSKHLIRNNAAIYWLPIHLKVVRDCYNDVIAAIRRQKLPAENVKLKYLALMATFKYARKENLIKFAELDLNLIGLCLSNFDDSVRSEAFQVVCCNAKSKEKIIPDEMGVIRMYLPLNMSSDSAVFRQQLVYCAKCLCERIHDSIYPAIKAAVNTKHNPEDSNYVEDCQTFLKFLVETCRNSIHPEFTYQRKKTALDIYGTMLNIFFCHRKSIPACEAMFEDCNSAVLMEMLQDSVPELRSTASQLLVKYFNHLPPSLLERFTATALRLSRSPRAQDNETAAAIFEVVLKQTDLPNHVSLLKDFVSQLQNDAALMEANIIKSSYDAPVHGWFLVIDKCTRCLESEFMLQNGSALALLDGICSTVCEVIHCTIEKVFGYVTQPSTNCENYLGVSADFCEITERIDNLALGDGESRKDILLSDDHEVILAASWLCLLRGTALLATIASVVSRRVDEKISLTSISNTMVLVLTSCRHRGAIEGCYEAFLTVCRILLSCKVKNYQQIPENIIKTICGNLQTVTESNVTRRSAGIPLVVEAILVAESLCKSSYLFCYVVDSISTLSSLVPLLDESKDEKFDFPQVHALYILKHLFRNAQLGSSVLRISESVFEISIKCLSSPIWVVRNAATHLFGAVASRMLGQKNVDGSHIESLENSVSSGDFFCRYPTLAGILINEMKQSLPSDTLPNPGLHPMLCLLSKLVYCDDDETCIPDGLVETVTKFLDSPVYAIRCMAAKSLLGLVRDKMACTRELLNGMSDRLHNSNSLHGLLVLVQEAMKTDDQIVESEFIYSKLFTLWITESLHPINGCIIVEILRNCKLFVKEKKSEFLDAISAKMSSSIYQIGHDDYQYQLMKTRLALSTNKSLELPLKQLVKHNANDSAALKAVTEQLPYCGTNEDLTTFLLKCIKDGDHRAINKILKAFSNHNDISRIFCSIPKTFCNQLVETAFDLLSSMSALSLQCSGLKVLSLMILTHDNKQNQTNCEPRECQVAAWIHHVTSRTSDCKASEPLRLSAAESVDIVGCKVFEFALTKKKELASFVCAVLSLLHDEQTIIRQHVCSFVAKLTGCRGNGIFYHTSATKNFLHYFFDIAPLSEGVTDLIVAKIFKLEEDALLQRQHSVLFDSEPFNLYEEPLEIAQMVAEAFLNRGVKKIDETLLDKIAKELIDNITRIFHKGSNILDNLIHLKCFQMAVQLSNSLLTQYTNDMICDLELRYQCPYIHAIVKQEIRYTLQICDAKLPKALRNAKLWQ